MKERFINRAFREETLEIIAAANSIIDEYSDRGFTLTLRQLYYQFVARDLIPNRQSEYKRLGSIVDDGRKAGLIDWAAIEDRTRNLETPIEWPSPDDAVRRIAASYQENPWRDQPDWPEVWIEKDALTGVIEPVCDRMRVPYFSCRGYVSSSEVYAAGKRFYKMKRRGKRPVVLHLGDHDPSGLQMTEDITDRLRMFAGHRVEVRRLALNWDQVQQYNPPPNPAKETDSRFATYQAEHGDESWELDALDPTVIDGLIQRELDRLVVKRLWDASMKVEEENKHALKEVGDSWDDIADYLADRR